MCLVCYYVVVLTRTLFLNSVAGGYWFPSLDILGYDYVALSYYHLVYEELHTDQFPNKNYFISKLNRYNMFDDLNIINEYINQREIAKMNGMWIFENHHNTPGSYIMMFKQYEYCQLI